MLGLQNAWRSAHYQRKFRECPISNIMTGAHWLRIVRPCFGYRVSQWTLADRSCVSTWSPLAATFNTKPALRFNTKLSGKTTGLFGIEELRDPTGFHFLKARATEETDRLVAESCSPHRKRKMVTIFDELSDTLCKVADMAEFVRIAHPDHRYAHAAEDASLSINALVERLNTNQDIYKALKNVIENGDIVPTDEVDRHVAKLFLFDFEQSGIHLDEQKRTRVVQLNDYILQTGALFMHATSLPRAVARDKLPENMRTSFPTQGDNVVVTGLCADASNEMMRQAAYRIYMYPDSLQEKRLQNLLVAREELANLCGFPTFAHRVLRGSLAESPDVVIHFLDALAKAILPYAQLDWEALLAKKKQKNEFSQGLHMWDTPYLSAIIKNETSTIEASEFVPYFSLGTCMEGLNFLFNNLYGITLETQETDHSELWAPEVHKLAVVKQNEGILGYIYCDFMERSGKPNQDCHFTIQGGRELSDGSYQLPVVVLLLNFPKPSWTQPCLLNPGMVDNLFHEMGHAMHSMLARTKYQHVTGTRCSTDFAEVPSVLMEYFASDPRVLAHFARDYKTGKNIPYDMLLRMCNAKNILSANELQLQIFYAMLDQRYHGNITELRLQALAGDKGTTTTDILAQIQEQYYGLPHVPQTAWQLRFGHLVGYGGKYYSYLMSKAVAAWIWQTHFQADPFNRDAGERYRKEILAHGGGRPPKELLENFLKENVSPDAMVSSLVSEIEDKRKKNCNESGL